MGRARPVQPESSSSRSCRLSDGRRRDRRGRARRDGAVEGRPAPSAGCFMQGWIDGPATEGRRQRTALGRRDPPDVAARARPSSSADGRDAGAGPSQRCGGGDAAVWRAVTAWHGLVNGRPRVRGRRRTVASAGGPAGVSMFRAPVRQRCTVPRSSRPPAVPTRSAGLEKYGLRAAINYKTSPKWGRRRPRESRGGLGVDHVIEVGGAGTARPNRFRAVRNRRQDRPSSASLSAGKRVRRSIRCRS